MMPDPEKTTKWRVVRRGAGIVIRGEVRHARVVSARLDPNPCARAGTLSFGVSLSGLEGSADEVTTPLEYFLPEVPEGIERIEIIDLGPTIYTIERATKSE